MSFYEYTPYDVLSIESTNSAIAINIFPNPTSDFLTVNAPNLSAYSVSVYNMEGRLILNQESTHNASIINLIGLNTGVYVFCLNTSDNQLIYSQQLIIQK
jgi:hypothetical protein